MEEDVGAKAPVTRLRRRLSVEQSEEVKSPSAPSTPGKKRGGRLAAKPQLELIDENSSENTARKQTKKTAAKDVIDNNEDKVLTPSRRSTRIKSNTSIVLDTPQSFESPRAKRAARRNSQIGSDNEAPITPARQTRRSRKDSTTSVDKQETVTTAKTLTPIIADSIVEEVETDSQKLDSSKQNERTEITPKRKSPRLLKKDKLGNNTESDELLKEKNVDANTNKSSEIITNTNKASDNKISDDSFQLINRLNERPIYKTHLNNSTSSVNAKNATKNRTKSWTATENLPDIDYNINKQNQTEMKNKENVEVNIEESESNNSNLEQDNIVMKTKDVIEKDSTNESSINKRNSVSTDNKKSDKSLHDKSNPDISLSTNDQDDTVNNDLNETQKLLKTAPVADIQSFIYYDDSDSDNRGKPIISDKPIESEDQCVPVVPEISQKSIFNQNENDKESYNDTCEPMDIDETIPHNVSLINTSDSKQEKGSLEKSQELSPEEIISKSPNKSKRESTSALSISQNIEKSGNENKSTLILSQLKDETDYSLTKSPKNTVDFLPKSANDIKNDEDIDKKDTHDYMTSTPLQQKNLKKIAIQINSSVINDSNNGSAKTFVKKYNKNNSNQPNKSCNHSSTEESESEHVSTKEKSDFLDDEAEEASDDYESGDSQDEEEKQYEIENEIPEKGETLGSSDNETNDTDYEKDSFVVSSDEEDNDLLSGSGDDLSMSDNELNQSKKSKNKFNKRKLKEQKKASREMFEARHNTSNSNTHYEVTKGRKNKRQRLNSSTLVSEEEIMLEKSRKSKRLKLDSSQESTGDKETDSKVDENNVCPSEEHEITTVCNESIVNKKDPLSIKVKSEPQTPVKHLNISTVPIHEAIEEVQVDQNNSVMNTNETSDPLQEDSNASSISENMEITSNYDSVLKELNKVGTNKKIKSLDMSLNLNKKTKQSAKPPIVDNLNLTNTKISKNVNSIPQSAAKSNLKEKKMDFDESSSDSIDLQLLFSEDSCDSVKKDQNKTKQETESFIPLKRTEAKTNILEDNTNENNMHQKQDVVSVMNKSNSNDNINLNKNKKKNSISVSDDITSDKSNISMNKSNHDVSLNTSSIKKKKNSNYTTDGINHETNTSNVQENISQNESSQNILINTSLNTSKKKKKNSISVSDEVDTVTNTNESIIVSDISLNNTMNSSSKKKRDSIALVDDTENIKRDNNLQHVSRNIIDHNLTINTTLDTSSKKKKNSISVEDTGKNIDINSTLNTSSKKKKKCSISLEDEQFDSGCKSIEVMNVQRNSNEVLTESSKKKKKHNASIGDLDLTTANVIDEEDTTNTSAKKKKKKVKEVEADIVEDTVNASLNTSSSKKKKKVKAVDLHTPDQVTRDDDSDAAPEEIPYTSHKNTSAGNLSDGVHMFIDTEGNQDWNTLITSGSSKKKDKKKKAAQETTPEINDNDLLEVNNQETVTSKKRKRKSSTNSISRDTVTKDPDSDNEPVQVENKRKKQKISQSEVTPIEIKDTTQNKNKKRKQREDDDVNMSSKMFKQNATDKINVPRLPPAILNQLEDKPRKEVLEMKKAKVVSTTQFIVEEAKKIKNKPSKYLEESVYLNNSVEEKKQKGFIKIPKVLPFVPTATISGSGFTTKFQINVLQKETKFVAQTSNLTGFKNDYLGGKKIKKVGTYELYKSQRNRKLSKF